MKNWRKQIIAAMMVFALAGALVPSGQAVETRGFSDVPDTAWYAEAVNWCIENDIMSGITAASVAPDSAMTRASTAEALYRAAKRPAVTHISRFSDVNASANYFNAVLLQQIKIGKRRVAEEAGHERRMMLQFAHE